jgi:hypothetical protein
LGKTLFGPTVSICYRQFLNQGDTRGDKRCAKTGDGSSVLPPPKAPSLPDFYKTLLKNGRKLPAALRKRFCANPVIVSTTGGQELHFGVSKRVRQVQQVLV